MTRIARVVAPGLPHHVTQRGARRERVFFEDGDCALYRDWLGQSCRPFGHVRLILTPEDGEGLALALSWRRRLYAGFVNARARQTGHLFQGRFGSVALDEDHLINAARSVVLNPAPAGSRRGRRTGSRPAADWASSRNGSQWPAASGASCSETMT
jgi:putative transposase